MIAQLPAHALSPRVTIDRLIENYGAMPVLWATIKSLLLPRRRRPRPPDIACFSPYLRRDVGLDPYDPVVPKYYDLR